MGKNWLLLIFCFFIFTPLFVNGQNFNEFLRIPIPGRIQGKGTYFEIKDSKYLNVSLFSEKEIEVSLESIPRMVSLILSSSTDTTTTLTLKGFQPNKKYYKYEDSYKNGIEILTDETGSYTWLQDLSKPHHVWFQEEKGTIFLPEDCSTYGSWNETERICKLNQNVTTSIEISTSSMILDCQGHSITGELYFGSSKSVYGVYLNSLEKITIKNCVINNFIYGIYIHRSSYNTISTNKITNNGHGIGIFYSTHNIVSGNTIENNGNGGIWLFYSSDYNSIFQNTIINSYAGIFLVSSSNNTIYKNNITSNILRGIDLYSSNYNIISENDISYSFGFFEPRNNFGVYIHDSSNFNLIFKNIIHHNSDEGILIASSLNNDVFENEVRENGYGISLGYDSSNNKIYHNNFIDNVQKPQVRIFRFYGKDNFFDNGYPSGGNYWSDYYGKDEKSGENQDQEGSDGIGDTPYTFEGGQDRYPFVKENGWLSLKNQPPIPIINFSPKNPVKGVKVKFDASSSTDPDGEIVNFEWQIGASTSTGTTTEFTFNENGEYQITLIATDNDGATSSTSTTIKVEPFSFAIITDLHIGRGYPDYDGPGFDDGYNGEEYYLTQRLRKVVNWIIQNKDNVQCDNATCTIKFLAVLGDIADSGEKSEFLKAKEILDELNNHGILYVPVFGNHDVWPHTDENEATTTLGENYFDEIFWDENATNTKLMKEILNWERDEIYKNYKNFTFSYGGINFIGLDFNSREPFMKFGKGVGADAVLNEINKKWLEKKLEEFKGEPVILFAHHPFIFDPINAFSFTEFPQLENLLKDNITVFFDFAGHIHSFEEWHGKGWWVANANKKYTPIAFTNVLTTEALMVGSNGRGVEEETEENGVVNGKKGIIRIVKVSEKNEIKPNNWETTETGDEFLAFNPSLSLGFSIRRQFKNIPCVELEAHKFSEKPFDFLWNFGGKTSSVDCNSDFSECLVCYEEGGEYKITLFAKDKNSNFTESISKKITVNEAIIPRTIKKPAELIEKGIEFISEKTQMSFDKIGQTVKDKVRIFKKKSPVVPVGEIKVHFENLKEDLDLSSLVVDTDFEKQKSILYMENWPNVIERSKVLFLPKK